MAAGFRQLLGVVGALFVCTMLVFGACWAPYARMEFNSEGRYYDREKDVVYHEEERGFFAFGAIASALLAGCAFAAARRLARRTSDASRSLHSSQ